MEISHFLDEFIPRVFWDFVIAFGATVSGICSLDFFLSMCDGLKENGP